MLLFEFPLNVLCLFLFSFSAFGKYLTVCNLWSWSRAFVYISKLVIDAQKVSVLDLASNNHLLLIVYVHPASNRGFEPSELEKPPVSSVMCSRYRTTTWSLWMLDEGFCICAAPVCMHGTTSRRAICAFILIPANGLLLLNKDMCSSSGKHDILSRVKCIISQIPMTVL